MDDPYIDPETGVLKNKRGFKTERSLREFEYRTTNYRIDQLNKNPIAGEYDLQHLQDIHEHLFQDVYEWAGQTRVTDLEKGENFFAYESDIEKNTNFLSKRLAEENCLKGLNRTEFTERLAFYHGEFNAIHPFREGNGRTLQVLTSQLARGAGYNLDLSSIGKERWNNASRSSFDGDLEPMKQIFRETVKPLGPEIESNREPEPVRASGEKILVGIENEKMDLQRQLKPENRDRVNDLREAADKLKGLEKTIFVVDSRTPNFHTLVKSDAFKRQLGVARKDKETGHVMEMTGKEISKRVGEGLAHAKEVMANSEKLKVLQKRDAAGEFEHLKLDKKESVLDVLQRHHQNLHGVHTSLKGLDKAVFQVQRDSKSVDELVLNKSFQHQLKREVALNKSKDRGMDR